MRHPQSTPGSCSLVDAAPVVIGLLLSACTSKELVDHADLEVVPAAMPTVMHVMWTSEVPTVGSVTVSDGVPAPPPELEASTTHDIRVIGLHADSTYDFTVSEDDGSGWVTVGIGTETTGSLDPAVVPFTVVEPILGDDAPLYFLLSAVRFHADGYSSVIWISDREGLPVWGAAVRGLFPMFPIWSPHIGVQALNTDIDDYGRSRLDVWSLDGELSSLAMPGAHHESLWLPDGTLVYTRTESRVVDGTLLGGDQLIERSTDGTEITVWDAFEDFPATPNEGWEQSKLADGAADWTHANGIEYIAAEDDYLLSLYYPGSIVRIDRATGTTEWILGGADSQFSMAADAEFLPQHAPSITGDGILLFDNGDATTGSRLESLVLDESARTAHLGWQWAPEPTSWNPLLGHVESFRTGLIATWGIAPDLYLYDREHALTGHLVIKDAHFTGALGAARGLASLY